MVDNTTQQLRDLFTNDAKENTNAVQNSEPQQTEDEQEQEQEQEQTTENPAQEQEQARQVLDPAAEALPEPTPENVTVTSLAAAIEVDPEYLYAMQVSMGEGVDAVPLGQLKDRYQSITKENESLKKQIEEQSVASKGMSEQANANQGMSNDLMAAFSDMDAIKRQFENTDWNVLESSSPGEAALLRQKFQEAFAGAQGKAQQAEAAIGQRNQAELVQAASRTLELIPAWQDKAVRATEQAQIQTALESAGYSPQAIHAIKDPTVLVLMRELVQLRTEKEAAKAAITKVRAAPKALKNRGKLADSKANQADKLKAKVQNAKPGSRKQAELDAVKALFAANQVRG